MLESSQLVALEANYGSLSPTRGERTNDSLVLFSESTECCTATQNQWKTGIKPKN
jgi:hypothetical protein